MTKYTRGISAPLVLTLALVFSACSVSEKKDTALATDSALNKDLQLAGRDTASQPALKDVPTTPAAEVAPPPKPTMTRPATTTKPKPAPTKPTSKPVVTPQPKTTTTASGNTETKNSSGSSAANAGGSVGSI